MITSSRKRKTHLTMRRPVLRGGGGGVDAVWLVASVVMLALSRLGIAATTCRFDTINSSCDHAQPACGRNGADSRYNLIGGDSTDAADQARWRNVPESDRLHQR